MCRDERPHFVSLLAESRASEVHSKHGSQHEYTTRKRQQENSPHVYSLIAQTFGVSLKKNWVELVWMSNELNVFTFISCIFFLGIQAILEIFLAHRFVPDVDG